MLNSCSAVSREHFWLIPDSLSPSGRGIEVSPRPRSKWCHKEQRRGMSTTAPGSQLSVGKINPGTALSFEARCFQGLDCTMKIHPRPLNPNKLFTGRTACKALKNPSSCLHRADLWVTHCLQSWGLKPVPVHFPSSPGSFAGGKTSSLP